MVEWHDMIRGFNSVDRARNFYQAVKLGKQPVVKFLAVGTMRAIRDLNIVRNLYSHWVILVKEQLHLRI